MRNPQVKGVGRVRLGAPAAASTGLVVALGAVLALGQQARADGGLPGSLGIMLPADRAQEIVLATNFGLISSDDGGATWLWTCEQPPTSMANVYAIGPPPAPAGAIGDRYYALSPVEGLAYSDDGSCSWQRAGGVLSGASVTDFFADPTNPSRVLAAAAAIGDGGGVRQPSIYASADGGATFDASPLYTAPAGAAIVGVEIARSDPQVIYVAYYLTLAGAYQPALLRSADGGKTWSPLGVQAALGPNIVRILAVDPADSNLIYLRVSALGGAGASGVDAGATAGDGGTPGADKVVVTRDGGLTFAEPLTITDGQVSAFARLGSGTVLVGALINLPGGGGGTRGAGYRSMDGGLTFVPWTLDPQPHLVGLAERREGTQSVVYLSAKNYSDGWALATSTDEGATVTPVMSYDQVRGIKPCAQQVCADICNYEEGQAVWSADVCSGSLLDGGTITPPSTSSGCHCGAAGRIPSGWTWLAALALALAVKLRHRVGRTR
jgi:hypothetical protein